MAWVRRGRSSRSPRSSWKQGEGWACARNSDWPVEKLSKPTTECPSSRSWSVRLLPMKPAAPVTNARKLHLPPGGRRQRGAAARAHAGERVADGENIAHVANVSVQQFEAAVSIVVPADGHFLDAEPEAMGQRQDLHVEHVAIDLLQLEELEGDLPLEEFETALAVVHAGKADHQLHEIMKALGADLAVPRLAPLDFGPGQGAGAGDHFVTFRQERPDLVVFAERNLV